MKMNSVVLSIDVMVGIANIYSIYEKRYCTLSKEHVQFIESFTHTHKYIYKYIVCVCICVCAFS